MTTRRGYKEIFQEFFDEFIDLGMDEDEAGIEAYKKMQDALDPSNYNDPFKAEGGRVGMQEGGTPDYGDIVKTIMDSFPPPDQQEIRRGSPQVEALQAVLGPQIAKGLGTPISPTGGTTVTGETFESFLPTVAPQTQAQ